MKKAAAVLLSLAMALSLAACGKKTSSTPYDKDDLADMLAFVKTESEALENAVTEDGEALLAKLGNSYDTYDKHKKSVTEFYDQTMSRAEEFYSTLQTVAGDYYKCLAATGLSDHSAWDGAMDEFYDAWDKGMDDFYDAWDDAYDDVYDRCDALIDDATDTLDYAERSEVWSAMYQEHSDAWAKLYEAHSDAWSVLYRDHTEVWSGFYNRQTDVDAILKAAARADESIESEPAENAPIESGGKSSQTPRDQSGFDPATNQTIEIGGVEFSFPAYFDARADGSTEQEVTYYPSPEDHFCSLTFYAEQVEGITQTQFNENKRDFADAYLEDVKDATDIRSDEATFADLPGWQVSCRRGADTEDPATFNFAFVYDENTEKIIAVELIYDDDDASGYDYVGDYQKVLNSAKIVPSAASTPRPEPTEETESDGLRAEFKEAMDAYEAFYQEYCAFMKKLSENPSDGSLLAEYADILSRADEMNEAFEAWDEDALSGKELEYYLAVNLRVMEMLANLGS